MALVALDLRSTAKAGVANDPTPGMGLFIDQGKLWAGPWQWHMGLDGDEYWDAPALIDPLQYVDLGSDPLSRMRQAARDALADLLELDRQLLPDSHLADLLAHYILGTLADPTGVDRVKPLRMGRRGLKLYLGNPSASSGQGFGLVLSEPFSRNHPNFDATLAVRHADYRRNKAAGVALETLRKWTGHDMQALYGRMADELLDELVPAEFVDDGWLAPETTITDDFNRADESLDVGSWDEVSGDWSVSSNEVTFAAGVKPQSARHQTSLSSDDQRCQIDIASVSGDNVVFGPMCRFQSDAETGVYGIFRQANGVRLRKIVTGTITNLTNFTSVTEALPDELKIDVDDSDTLTAYWNGTMPTGQQVTETTGSGNLQAGLSAESFNNTATGDDFEAADLGGSPVGFSHSQAVIIG